MSDSKKFDLVILNGRVIDPETKLDAVRNVGITGDTIKAVTKDKIEGKETIDAAGHVVSPGFIDMHNHNSGVPFGEKCALRDGVTTPLELEAGVSPVDEWYSRLEGKCRTNYGATVGNLAVRERTFNPAYKSVFAGDIVYDLLADPKDSHTSKKWMTRVPTAEELKKIRQMLDEGLKQGALGVGNCVGYMTGGCTTEETLLAQELAGKYGRSTFLHGRFSSQMPPTSGLLGFLEQMAGQETYGGGLVLQHMTAQALADTERALEFVDAAAAKGIKVIPEVYPYDYGGTIVGADYLHPDNYGPNMGRTYSDIIETATVTPLTKERYEELIKTAPFTNVMFYNATEETVFKALAHPATVLGSDAFPYCMKSDGSGVVDWDVAFDAVNGHPRGAGAHAHFLSLVRDKKIDISLTTAIAKMTNMIADYLVANGVEQMAKKGRLQEGMDADITVFDPQTVTANSTMQDGGLPSSGIPYVLVNGTVVVKDSVNVEHVFPGKAIRCST